MSKKKKTFSDYLMLALMGLLVLGLGGFGIRNFSGGSSTIATVGDRDITAAAYHRAMAQAARAQQAAGASGTSLAALEEQGIPAQVRGQLIGFAASGPQTLAAAARPLLHRKAFAHVFR